MTASHGLVKLFVDQRLERPWMGRFSEGAVGVVTRPSPLRRGANQDEACVHYVEPGAFVFAIADGLGGGPDGDIAARVALEALTRQVQQAVPGEATLRSHIIDGIEAANRAVQRLESQAATTLVVVEVCRGEMRSYHVGDSVALLANRQGRVKFETLSHSPVAYGVEAGMIEREDAMHHSERHLVFNVVGTDEMRIEVGPRVPLAHRDTVILASDGVLDNLRLEELAELASRGRLEAAVQSSADAASRRMANPEADEPSKPDDLTLVLFRPNPRLFDVATGINAVSQVSTGLVPDSEKV